MIKKLFSGHVWYVRAALVAALLGALSAASMAIASAVADKPAAETKKAKDELYNQAELFADALSVIRTDYVDEADSKKLIYGALRGMCGSLDDFSEFLDPDEHNEIQLETRGEFGGVGIEIGIRDGILTVIAPIAGTPADAAGIMAGDRIIKIDGKITKRVALNEAVKGMRGDPGTMVTFTIWREKENRIFDVPLKRAVITIHSVKQTKFIRDRIGYIKLSEFQENTPDDLDKALAGLEKDGMDGLILDLRNNPGGLLDTAVDVGERFLGKGAGIVSIKARDKDQDMVFTSSGRRAHLGYPLVVLVNEGSASASEIVAGAVKDNKRGVVVGMKTFGKASVQTVIPLKDGSAVRLTTAAYLTPSGILIRGQGITPDVVVEKEAAVARKSDIFKRLEEKGDLGQEELKTLAAAKGEDENEDHPSAGAEKDGGKDDQLETAVNTIKRLQGRK